MRHATPERPLEQEDGNDRSANARSGVVVPLRSYTKDPDGAFAETVDAWRVAGLHQYARVYRALQKAAGLEREINADKLLLLASEFRMPPLGSKRRVQQTIAVLVAWDLVRWKSRGKLRRQGTSKVLVAGTDYPFPRLAPDYLEQRTKAITIARRMERRRHRANLNKRPTTPLAAKEWKKRELVLTELWEPIAGNRVRHLENVWNHIAAVFEEKGFHPVNASLYLRKLAEEVRRSPRRLLGVKCPMRFAKSREGLQRYVENHRHYMKLLEGEK